MNKKIILSIALIACAITSFASASSYKLDGVEYNGYWSSGTFYITSGFDTVGEVTFKKVDVVSNSCTEKKEIYCTNNQNIKEQMIDLLNKSESICIDMQVLQSLSLQLQTKKEIPLTDCVPVTTQKEIAIPMMYKVKTIKVKGKTKIIYVRVLPNTGINL